jgi:hypothetical protein
MAVLDETEQSVGQVQDVSEETVLVRIHRDVAVRVEAIEAVSATHLVLPLHIDLGTTQPPPPAVDPYTVNVPDPSIFLG